MIIEEVINFFKKVPPFQFLEEGALNAVVSSVSMDFYPKDTLILRQDDPPAEYLRIIKKGGVKVYRTVEDGDEIVIDYRAEGDNFGILSIIGRDRVRSNVMAIDDTICYLIDKETVLNLLNLYPVLTEYFFKSHIAGYLDKTFKEMRDESLFYGSSDRILFTTQVGDIAIKNVVTAGEDISIQESAQLMARNKISSLIIINEKNLPVGIVTDRDLREKVLAKGKDFAEPIKNIMSLPLIQADTNDYCFEALLKMTRHNIHHLVVIEEGRLKGIVTNHDLMILQGASPISIAKEIENQQTIDGLASVSKKINKIIALLLKEGAKASNITKIISEINDRLTKKILEIAERRFGRPPINYCWIGFGSEGRMEQTFKTDQDNAIIYADTASPVQQAEVNQYFSEFTLFVKDSLIRCGFPPCPADYMASNPQWRQPLKEWKKYFLGWINTSTPDAILKSLIFFDFRQVFGDFNLADELRAYLAQATKGQEKFFAEMADAITKNRPPLSILKQVVVEKGGEHRNKLNVKTRGLVYIVDIARLFAIELGSSETSTIDRLRLIKDSLPNFKKHAEAIEEAFEFMTLLRMHNQIEQLEKGVEIDNYINPEKLTVLKKKMLRESFNLISEVQDQVVKRYVPEFMRIYAK